MTNKERKLFGQIRKQVAEFIRELLEEDDYCKSYEGTWEVLASYPNYFEDKAATAAPNWYQITLHCYLIGPSRHYDWDGKTFLEALRKCKADIDIWTRKERE